MHRRFRTVDQVSVSDAPNDIGAIRLLRFDAGSDGSKPIAVSLFFVSNQLSACYAMEIEHRAHHRRDIPEDVNEGSIWKQLPQATDVQGIFGRSINPTSLRSRGSASGFKPTWIKV